ncbi:MAG: DUF4258 domain-containing protein [Magnetococcales bacterium]|nr:DUF4258 domain-containing protein [Magnetococcales bacterium]
MAPHRNSRQHALRQIFERRITLEDLYNILYHDPVIEHHPDDTPHPNCPWLGKDRLGRPLHVVAVNNDAEDPKIIITVYHPNPDLWLSDWTTQRNSP